MRSLTLRQRIFLTNAVVIAIAAAVLVLTPATVSSPAHLREVVVVVTGLSIILLINLVLLRHALTPLERLTTLMRRVEPLRPGRRVPVYGQEVEIVELTRAFNDMLDRLEAERQDSASRSIRAQESERRRVARELHDEVGQSLTAVVLQIDRLSRMATGDMGTELAETREQARSSLEDVRDIARRLRPEALDDLGLPNALASLADRLSESSGIRIDRRVEGALPELSPEAEVVFYRVAQEGVTNALRHAEPTRISLGLVADRDTGELSLTIQDDGRGMNGSQPGAGIQGMRERALLLNAQLEIDSDSAGTTVTLRAIPE